MWISPSETGTKGTGLPTRAGTGSGAGIGIGERLTYDAPGTAGPLEVCLDISGLGKLLELDVFEHAIDSPLDRHFMSMSVLGLLDCLCLAIPLLVDLVFRLRLF